MFAERLLSGIVLVGIMLLFGYLGGYFLLALITAIALIGLYEYVLLVNKRNVRLPYRLLAVLIVVFCLVAYYNALMLGLALSFTLGCLVCWMLLKRAPFSDFAMSVCGALYVGWGFCHIIALRQLNDEPWLFFLLLLIPWLTDTGAYVIGVLFGRHKIMTSISPKKSWEGAIGGMLVCAVGCYLYGYFLFPEPAEFLIPLAIIGSILGQIGDFLESWLKRWAEVKDSGKLIPGHGGILDRFDSMIFVAPYLFYIFIVFMV